MLGGGRSSEHEVSLASAASVCQGLEQAGHRPVPITVGRDGLWRREQEIVAVTPGEGLGEVEVVFPVLHGPYGEDGTVQGLLECLGVPYVGAGVLTSALSMNKVVFKELMRDAGVPQVDFRSVRGRGDAAAGPPRCSIRLPSWGSRCSSSRLGSALRSESRASITAMSSPPHSSSPLLTTRS